MVYFAELSEAECWVDANRSRLDEEAPFGCRVEIVAVGGPTCLAAKKGILKGGASGKEIYVIEYYCRRNGNRYEVEV